MAADGPFFVKVDEFKDIVDTLKQVRTKVDDANKALERLNKLRSKEEEQITEWKQQLDDVSGRITTINTSLFEQ